MISVTTTNFLQGFWTKATRWRDPNSATYHSFEVHGDKLTETSKITDAYFMIMLDKPDIDENSPTLVKKRACRDLASIWEKDKPHLQILNRRSNAVLQRKLSIKSIDQKKHDQLFSNFNLKKEDLQMRWANVSEEVHFNTLKDLHPYIKSVSQVLDSNDVAHAVEQPINSTDSGIGRSTYSCTYKCAWFILVGCLF